MWGYDAEGIRATRVDPDPARVGSLLTAQAAGQVKRLSLELGGNAPFLVFSDADMDRAVEGALLSRFRNAGQTCVCANRFLVEDGVHDQFVSKLAARVADLRSGDGLDRVTNLGPLIDSAAARRVEDLVRAACADGAKIAGSAANAREHGAFAAPLVLADVTPSMRIAREEIFGPVACVIRFSGEEEAIRLANDTPYGLAAYAYTRDAARQWRLMERLDFGMVAINDSALSSEVAPFGGIKQSGYGREGGRHGLADYMSIKYCLVGGLDAE